MSIYCTAAEIAQNVEGGAGLRSQLYSKKFVKDQSHLPEINFLVNNALQKKDELDDLIAKTNLKEKLQDKDIWLARVLTTELVLGKKSFKAFCPVSKIIYSKKAELKAASVKMKVTKKPETFVPRYVRVDVHNVTMTEVHQYLKRAGYKLGEYPDYKLIPKNGYCLDMHVPALLVFHMKAPVHTFDWVTSGCLILQDKASCLVAPLLAPHPCSTVLDMCAAPGYKTHHVASYMHGLGRIIAVDKAQERFDSLSQLKKKFSLHNVLCINGDVLGNQFSDTLKGSVEYILLDPPCSGSGMAKNHDFSPNAKSDTDRYDKLHNLQVKMLKSALSEYPAARRVTYSTCSITEQENESVIDEVLKNLPGGFSLVDLRPFYPGLSRGRSSYKCGSKCIRLSPETDNTNGFFIAMFERITPLALPVPFKPEKEERGKKRSAKEALNSGGKKFRVDLEAEDSDASSEKEGYLTANDETMRSGDAGGLVKVDDEDASEDGEEDDESDEESDESANGFPVDGVDQDENDENEASSDEEETDGESDENLEDLQVEKMGRQSEENAEEEDDDESGDETEESSDEEDIDKETTLMNEKTDLGETASESDSDDEDEGGGDSSSAKETSEGAENGPNQYGPRQFWAKGHKKFGGNSDSHGGQDDRGSQSSARSSKEWSPRGRGGFRGGRGSFRDREGGDRGGRGGFRGGRGGFRGGRGGFRDQEGGDRGGRGGFRGGRGGFRDREGGEHRGRGGFRGGRGNFRGGDRRGRGNFRGGDRGGRGGFRGGRGGRGGFRGNRGGGSD